MALRPWFCSPFAAPCLALFALAAPLAHAAEAPPADVLSLNASASLEVARDVLSIVFSTAREGTDAGVVQTGLKQALDAALVEARKVARPGQLEVQTGNFSLYPRYSNKGQTNGWQGTAELVVEGKDMQAIAQLAGRIGTMSIARVNYALSRELRQKTEGSVTAEAIAEYRAKAADYARQFGYAGYTIREVSVTGNEPGAAYAAPMQRAKAMSAAADEALPVEPGKGTVSVTVNGSVLMTR